MMCMNFSGLGSTGLLLLGSFCRCYETQAPEADTGGITDKPLRLQPRVIHFNLMVAGLSGLGKTTSCNLLFNSWKNAKGGDDGTLRNKMKTKLAVPDIIDVNRILPSTQDIDVSRAFERYDEVSNTLLRVCIVDTPGFGNQVDHGSSCKPIRKYIARSRERQLRSEMSVKGASPLLKERFCEQVSSADKGHLVHCCLYFISPHRILQIDKHFMQQIQKDVTIVPVIAKSDTLTDEEISEYRALVVRELRQSCIKYYDFDREDGFESVEGAANEEKTMRFVRGRLPGDPLAIVGRDGVYPWGHVSVADRSHSDFVLLKDLLLSEHTENIIDQACTRYQRFRKGRLRTQRAGGIVRTGLLGGLLLRAILPASASAWLKSTAITGWSRLGPIASRLGPVAGRYLHRFKPGATRSPTLSFTTE
eukprot:gnl/MRDRNA2_/MRDRNA2_56282_c0_seq1.p1 gnl/MRDRNA2_/MRDRNA2_56282_c0~~gnl/MRDRNA2_/MRDRNA2_56282_c0_seq1.p1  ORF type:complete len:419 (+),score=45.80 gnl/MRDRNA2_/MRDRNA2_56282_c0_seq1:62-1318(+)